MLSLAPLGGGVFLGWALGANDAANVFGTAVASRIITFRRAAILCSCAIILGALLQGNAGIDTISKLTRQTLLTVMITSGAAALTVTFMTLFRLPVSSSQAIVGAIIGIGLATNSLEIKLLQKVIICWIATPFRAMFFALIAYKVVSVFIRYIPMSMLTRDKILWGGLLIVGIYGSYALGANNVANVTGIFSGKLTRVTDQHLALIGGLSIAFGVLTYSKRIMMAVGSGIMPLDAFTSFVAVLAMSITVHIFAFIGVPVSTSQGIVGAIIGIGLIRGVRAIHLKALRNICFGWLLTPVVSLILAAAGYAIASGLTAG